MALPLVMVKAVTRAEVRWRGCIPLVWFAPATHRERASVRLDGQVGWRSKVLVGFYLSFCTPSFICSLHRTLVRLFNNRILPPLKTRPNIPHRSDRTNPRTTARHPPPPPPRQTRSIARLAGHDRFRRPPAVLQPPLTDVRGCVQGVRWHGACEGVGEDGVGFGAWEGDGGWGGVCG